MSDRTIGVKVFRFDPSVDAQPYYKTYRVPYEEGMSAMDALDYIYQNQDGTLAYYDHAGCSLGICGRCTAKVNGKAGLVCQTPVEGDITLEPLNQERVIKDLVIERQAARSKETASEKEKAVVEDIDSVPLIIRREIEALTAAPLVKAFMEEFGREKTLSVAENVVKSLARRMGEALKLMAGGDSLLHFAKVMSVFGQGGSQEMETIEATPRKVSINVVRCKYAEMYRKHGLEEFGYLLSCGRDFALIEGFNPKIRFVRTQTIMEGAPFCDFRFSEEEE